MKNTLSANTSSIVLFCPMRILLRLQLSLIKSRMNKGVDESTKSLATPECLNLIKEILMVRQLYYLLYHIHVLIDS